MFGREKLKFFGINGGQRFEVFTMPDDGTAIVGATGEQASQKDSGHSRQIDCENEKKIALCRLKTSVDSRKRAGCNRRVSDYADIFW